MDQLSAADNKRRVRLLGKTYGFAASIRKKLKSSSSRDVVEARSAATDSRALAGVQYLGELQCETMAETSDLKRASSRTDEEDKHVQTCRCTLAWLDTHDNIMPKEYKRPQDANERKSRELAIRFRRMRQKKTLTRTAKQLITEIDNRRSNQKDVETCREVLTWLDDHDDVLPRRAVEDFRQDSLAKKFYKLRARAFLCSKHIRDLLQEISTRARVEATGYALREERRSAKRNFQEVLEQKIQAHTEWCKHRWPDEYDSRRLPEAQGAQPYPGLVNLGNTCYLGAVLQCLLHCDPCRAHLLALLPTEEAGEIAAAFCRELQSLTQHLVLGVEVPHTQLTMKFDVYSPHAFLDAFHAIRAHQRRALVLG